MKIGVLGAGSMGSGIAQVASTNGHEVVLFDSNPETIKKAMAKLQKILARLVEKGRITTVDEKAIYERISVVDKMEAFAACGLVIEAIVENLEVKKSVFAQLEQIVGEDCILATNTSSLSVASIAAACQE